MASNPGMSRRGPPPRPPPAGAQGPPPVSRPPPPGPPPTSARPSMPAQQAPPPIRFDDDQKLRQRTNGQQSKAYVQANMPFADFKDTRKKGSRRVARQPQTRAGRFRSWLFRQVFFFGSLYTLFGALFSCSSSPFAFDYNPNDSRAVCRSLAQTKRHVVPVVTPYIHAAHAKIDPYTGPYIKAASPYAQSAWKTTRPYYRQARKHSIKTYKKHVEPARKKAVKRTRQALDPHLKVVRGHYDQKVQPHVNTVQDALTPYQKMYMRDVAPYLSQAYSYSLSAGSASYVFYVNQVHPQVVQGLQQTHAFYINNADPALRRAYSLYIRPQADKLMAKVFARKAHAIGADVLRETKEHVREAKEEVKSSVSSENAAQTPTPSAESTGIAASVQRAAETAVKALPKVQHYVPDTLLGGGGDPQDGEIDPDVMKKADAELESVKKQLEAWETGMTSLFNKEYKLFTERIAEMRDSRMLDLPDHFDGLLKTAEDQVSDIIDKLAQSYERVNKDTEGDVEARTAQLAKIADTPLKKLRQARAAADEAIKSYAYELAKDEAKARDASVGELRSFVREAVGSYGILIDEAEFERTVEDFDGWDKGMIARARMFTTELDDLRRGNGTLRGGLDAVDLRKDTSNLAPYFADLRKQVRSLFDNAESTVESYAKASPLDSVALAAESVRKQARDISEQAVQSMGDAVSLARSRLGMAADTAREASQAATGKASDAVAAAGEAMGIASDKASDSASQAADSASEVVDSAKQAAADAADSVSQVADSASQAADDVVESASRVAGSASHAAGDAVDSATEAVGDAVKEASQAAESVLPTTGESIAEPDTEDNIVHIQPVDMPGDGVDAEGQPVDDGHQASEQFGATGSGEGRSTVLDAAGEAQNVEADIATPLEDDIAEAAAPAAEQDASSTTPDKVVAEDPAEPEPEPVMSIQPVVMPGDGVDAEGVPVAAADPTPEPTPDRHEEL